ncbi:Cell cycle checkpoint protein RAD17 [Fulvia fulva]|uniref:Cell cycle checkpoint protein RAD17 n=1 Tax=Passalora fulva TaxID=5499 RepID=A0A9Q8P442_PASFU|nr:Cell cycle checkpoint protein RAD17 [Fulvia fulva]KAK4634694.1 Cell cycle checkpoint protein RAD17 [Fulvia fulva]KAK4637605.1 Cell cycle checkpoint protein RAD17 [Fulvia fulva]UJO12421.1 Cell cycle checkpoint protein RAD17 [Fulvia fulva]WPV10206.1 Cell cycle checkpoint protein RAD17 [Fulvia fulva]WPV24160.1 Cell cycle checkpoint protein RAD17 [Fulvia fulva]
MGPRASRRRVVTSDDEDDDPKEIKAESPKPAKPAAGKLKAIKNGKAASTSKSVKATSPKSSPKKRTSKPKQETKEPPKPAANPIYSFFNNATQRQQRPQPSVSPDKFSTHREELDTIQDDLVEDDDHPNGTGTALSKGPSTALALRKRKFGRTQSFESESSLPSTASQKFRKASGGDRVPTLTVKNQDNRPWTEQFAPIDLSELAVHKRKVDDVRKWLDMALRGRRNKVLVLKGPAGSGKTTTVQLLAKDMSISTYEWKDPSGADYSPEGALSSAAQFEEFVGRIGKSAGLMLSSGDGSGLTQPDYKASTTAESSDRLQALLVEEFPNTFSKQSATLQSFRSTVAQYLSSSAPPHSSPTPLIMVISETLLSTNTAAADSFTAHRLLGPELITNPYVNVIEFNPVAPTFLIKALEAIVVKEARKSGRRRTPGSQVLKRIAESGDIRSAVSSLEFLCVRGDEEDLWSSKVTFTKAKQSTTVQPLTKAEQEVLKLVTNRESSLDIFHAVGKVVYNKRIDVSTSAGLPQPPAWLPQHRRSKIPENDPDILMDELGTDTSTFLAALHENYALSCSTSSADDTMESLAACMDNLSDSDLLSIDRFSFGTRAYSGSATDTLRQDEMSFQAAVRGILFSLPSPVHRSAGASGNRSVAHSMFYPTSLKLWRKKEEVGDNLELLISKLVSGGTSSTGRCGKVKSTTASGVESWQQNTSSRATSFNPDENNTEGTPQVSTELKNQMLLDQLPYMLHILSARSASRDEQILVDQIRDITRVTGIAATEDLQAENDDADDNMNDKEQWSTDRPDAEPGVKKQRLSGKKQVTFEAPQIPVELRVERLVLADDDIVDD